MSKYIFITGGVCSSLGKGIASASIGSLLESRGYRVTMQKIDPYLNVDAGTMSPFQHGEVYVTDDGAETDLDLGNYGRFTNTKLSELNSITTGKVYQKVIERERRGDYLGKTVQVIPHITGEIQNMITSLSDETEPDIQIIEVGGTVGDVESVPFLEAAREFYTKNRRDILFIHLTLIPKISVAGEYKTKPTQHSVGSLRQIGIVPDIIITRISGELDKDMRKKIALFCSVDQEDVIQGPDVDNIYFVPSIYHKQGLDKQILNKLGLPIKKSDISKWENIEHRIRNPKKIINIAMGGKYVQLNDAYKSVDEAIKHAAISNNVKVNIVKIDTEKFYEEPKKYEKKLKEIDGILIPGGFGSRGVEGKIKLIKYARENNIPFFGICLGMQCMAIEFARNVIKLEDVHSQEFDSQSKNPVIHIMEDQINITKKGGTMRLGAYPCKLKKQSIVYKSYNEELIYERHRHRYEFNNDYVDEFEKNGVIFSGIYEKQNLVEIMEWSKHPFGVGVQFHPEFNSKPFEAHPIFNQFIKSSIDYNSVKEK